MSGSQLIATIRDFHKDCGGCPVEQMCDEYEAVLAGNAVLLTTQQSSEVRAFLGRIVNHPAIFGPAHDIHDDAFVLMPLFPHDETARMTPPPKQGPPP